MRHCANLLECSLLPFSIAVTTEFIAKTWDNFSWLQRAIEEGADFIETDILASKDGALICFHDVTLDATTNVADYKEFSHRQRTYEVQGENITGWFVGKHMMQLSFLAHIFFNALNDANFLFTCIYFFLIYVVGFGN